uniref:Uncharacterized protein n=1 Tax=Spongospora subterranea TaxID=70186 RepID=A0A0H5R4M7_9EUKA|eukprot:CRZ03029.1 hypothetical protein [Spongospora subterranea]
MTSLSDLWLECHSILAQQGLPDNGSSRTALDTVSDITTRISYHCPIPEQQFNIEIVLGLIRLLSQYSFQHHNALQAISVLETVYNVVVNVNSIQQSSLNFSLSRRLLLLSRPDISIPARPVFFAFFVICAVHLLSSSQRDIPYDVVIMRPPNQNSRKGVNQWYTPQLHASDRKPSDQFILREMNQFKRCIERCAEEWSCLPAEEAASVVSSLHSANISLQLAFAQVLLTSGDFSTAATVYNWMSGFHGFPLTEASFHLANGSPLQAINIIVHSIRTSQCEFLAHSVEPVSNTSEYLSGCVFECVYRRSLMVDHVRLLMACLHATSYPIYARLALCQYAWPAFDHEFARLVVEHVDGNTLLEFEQFRELIVNTEMNDKFLSLHRQGRLHMRLSTNEDTKAGRQLRGASRDLNMTNERDLEDHIVNLGNMWRSIGDILLSLILNDISTYFTPS